MNRWSQRFATAARRSSLLCLGTAIALASGCGDQTFTTNPGNVDPSDVPEDHACLMGSLVELSRYSSRCERSSASLTSQVSDGVVFDADRVRTLESPCEEGPTPGFELVFDEASHSLFLDFSKVSAAGRFPEAGFEGYILDVILEEANGMLIALDINRESSTLPVDREDIVWDRDFIEVNLEGVPYDEESLLRLELVFARIPPI